MTEESSILFENARKKVIGADRQRLGIGTYGEKTVHAILKNYYEPDEDRQEIPMDGYVADIYNGWEIIEIQSGQFNRIREKLKAYLQTYPVTVVHPIPREKWLIWVDEESGELSGRRKSPKRGSPYHAFAELYKIKSFLKDPHLKIKLVLLDMEEYRLLNGWSADRKKGSVRFDRIPFRLAEEVEIGRIEDYMQFVPEDLPEDFTVKDFAKAAHIPERLAGITVNVLCYTETIVRTGKRGRAYIYKVKEQPGD